ncbi:cytochrome P450 4V2-like [Topomyia yanbarensis]|uniref:cytochrome P450 4V2-like n=1 Tax=Topomyia yanbarensis TaxID=2498891 RepID=UPI00273AC815|nr:cytochrome P450 4V2-like [Topomyia yanbarensis]
MLFLLLLSVLGVLLVYQFLKEFFGARHIDKIPTVLPVHPIVGHILMFMGKSSERAFWLTVKYFSQVDRLGKIMFGPKPFVLVNHPDLLQQILTSNDVHDKPFFYDFVGLGGGLITEGSGERWRRLRKLLNPTFNTRMLNSFLPIMDFRANKMIAKLRSLADGQTVIDISKFTEECTLEMVFSTTMGRKALELPGQREYTHHLKIIQNLLGERILNTNQYLGFMYRMSDAYKREHISRDYCNKFTDKIIIERRKELENTIGTEVEEDEFKTKSLNFLDEVLAIRKENDLTFSDQEISDHLYTIMTTATETSAMTIAYTCLFLAMHPEIQTKVRNEMNEVFYSPTVDINNDTLKQLVYTEMVIKEVLRICPVAPLIARQTATEIVLDGVRIPKGQIIAMCFFTLHRRKDIWGSEPERFDPERFRPETCQGRHPFAYLPFSGGLRNCIGARYAMNSMRIMLLRILQDFEIHTDLKYSDFRFKFEISLNLTIPYNVRLVNVKK